MLYNKPLKCICGRKPKLEKKGVYRKYACYKCNLQTFFSQNEECARELWNAQLKNIEKLKVRI